MVRDDGVEFEVIEVALWSLVLGKCVRVIEDRVKFLGTDPKGDQYVGRYGGHGYTLVDGLRLP